MLFRSVETKKSKDWIGNIPVISLKELSETHDNALVVVSVSDKYIDDIVYELKKIGIRFIF